MAGVNGGGSGWYPDPSGRHQLRFFATTWTDHVSDGGVQTISPLAMSTFGPAAFGPAPVAAGRHRPFVEAPHGGIGRAPRGAATPTGRAKPRGAVLMLVAGILMALGPMFSWETVSASGALYTGGSVKGTSEGAGPLVLVVGLVVAVLAVLVLTGTTSRRRAGIATLLVSAGSLVFCIGNWASISKDVDKAPDGVDASIGIGLILAVIGCILAAIAGITLIRRRA